MFYKYNPNNREYWKINRNQKFMTEAEWRIWNLALKGDKTWYRFLRQKLIWNYIVDFYCSKLKLCIEIDDNSHDWKGEYDEKRTKFLNDLWLKVIRYTNNDVNHNLDWVIIDLNERLKLRGKEIWKILPPIPSGTSFK